MKRLLINSIQGIGIASFIFLMIGIIFDYVNHGNFSMENYDFTKQVIGTIMVGIGFSAPSMIYDNEKIPFGLKVLFHMGIGCTVYIITAFAVGWMPVKFGWKNCLFFIVCELLIAFLIWLGFAFHYRKLANDMNKKIQEKDDGNSNHRTIN
ncbi:DUF3021 domain-containing protein [Anaeromicropila herbilytica]|uniref:DUF3021 domain-containing protein n=1 Tax=Anaeromicropila herbilytica TaxID=2785025 RepID=A0A7R7EPA8_9FIRM|nr:DUF3021 domain-containing protein [Anaeromicropila herbilytica]BCN32590.1 hypothetical protein bsdtb5_38850 [Anaeromicropila herbilytica]